MAETKTAMELAFLAGFRKRKLDPALYSGSAVPVTALVRHMAKHYSDGNIAEDVDCVLACCGSDADREAVRRYARARRTAPGFQGKSFTVNNHNRIAAGGEAGKLCERDGCEVRFTPERSTARFCSAKCRQRTKRGAPVTLSALGTAGQAA